MKFIIKSYVKARNLFEDLFFEKKIKFLHIGKTGGTFIRDNLKIIDTKKRIRILTHKKSFLKKDNNKYIFFVRDPIDRFISAFWSRYRKGKPRYFSDWSKEEQVVFNFFSTPNELAEAIYSNNVEKRKKAKLGLENISHLKMNLSFYLKDVLNIQLCLENIFYVGRLETINEDFQKILKKLGYDEKDIKKIKYDNITKHSTSNNYKHLSNISEKGKSNILKYYKKDFEIIEFLVTNRIIKEIK